MDERKNIIVFGASGDIGSHLIKYLLNKNITGGYDLIATGTRTLNFEHKLDHLKYIPVDITRKQDFEKLPDNAYAIIDLAGAMPARMSGYNPQKYIDVNITGTLNVLDYAVRSGADRILYAQSFGDIRSYAEESIVLHPEMLPHFDFNSDHTVYVMSKNFAVDLIHHYHEKYGLRGFIFRLPTIYLWSQVDYYYVDGVKHKLGYRTLINHAIHGEDIEIWGDPQRKKDMVYVWDFCQMLYLALFCNCKYGHYNVGTGVGTTLQDQIKDIIQVFGNPEHPSKIIARPDKPNAPQYIMDITNAVNDLDYKPIYNFKDALLDMKKESENIRGEGTK